MIPTERRLTPRNELSRPGGVDPMQTVVVEGLRKSSSGCTRATTLIRGWSTM